MEMRKRESDPVLPWKLVSSCLEELERVLLRASEKAQVCRSNWKVSRPRDRGLTITAHRLAWNSLYSLESRLALNLRSHPTL